MKHKSRTEHKDGTYNDDLKWFISTNKNDLFNGFLEEFDLNTEFVEYCQEHYIRINKHRPKKGDIQ